MIDGLFKLLTNRASHRYFLDKRIKKHEVDLLIKVAKSAPTSMDNHSFSIINVTDKRKKEEIGKWANQLFIGKASVLLLFVADFTRTDICKGINEINANEMHLQPLLSSFLNIGLSMMATIVQAEAMGIGSCCIGALRWGEFNQNKKNTLDILTKMFNLPKHTFIACGLIFGYKKKKIPPKPKLPNIVDVFENRYQTNMFTKNLRKEHNEALKNYYVNILKEPSLAIKSWLEVQQGVTISKKGEYSKIIEREHALIDHLHKQDIFTYYKF